MFPVEKKIQIIDVSVTIFLVLAASILGKISMNHFGDTWIALNGPVLGTLAVGELLWWRVRKRVIQKMRKGK